MKPTMCLNLSNNRICTVSTSKLKLELSIESKLSCFAQLVQTNLQLSNFGWYVSVRIFWVWKCYYQYHKYLKKVKLRYNVRLSTVLSWVTVDSLSRRSRAGVNWKWFQLQENVMSTFSVVVYDNFFRLLKIIFLQRSLE